MADDAKLTMSISLTDLGLAMVRVSHGCRHLKSEFCDALLALASTGLCDETEAQGLVDYFHKSMPPEDGECPCDSCHGQKNPSCQEPC
jgi:hypothetical protein